MLLSGFLLKTALLATQLPPLNRQAQLLITALEDVTPLPRDVIINSILGYLQSCTWNNTHDCRPHNGPPHHIHFNDTNVISTYYREYTIFDTNQKQLTKSQINIPDVTLYSRTYILKGKNKQYIVLYNKLHGSKIVDIYHIENPTTLTKIHTYTNIQKLVVSRSTRIAIIKHGNVLLFDSETQKENTINTINSINAYHTAFSPDSQYILIASKQGIVELCPIPINLTHKEVVQSIGFRNIRCKPYAIALSNRNKFAVATKDRLFVYRKFTSSSYYSYLDQISNMAFSADEHTLITFNETKGNVEIRKGKTGWPKQYLKPLTPDTKNIFAIKCYIDPINNKVIISYNNGYLRLWEYTPHDTYDIQFHRK